MKRTAVLLSLLVVGAACADDPAPVPASLDAVSAVTLPAATVATVVATSPTFEVRTASGKPIKGVPVTITAGAGSGSLASSPAKSLKGPTSIGTWTLGTASGTQTVTVSAAGLPDLVFTIEATSAAATTMAILEGDDQRAPENGPIPNPIRVRIADAHNNGVPDVTVTWTVTGGGGALPGATTSQTNASGVATAPTWTVGIEGSGEQILTATATGLNAVQFSAVVQDPPAEITVEVEPPLTVPVGLALVTAPTFVVRDANGNPLSGVPVTIVVTAGTGSVTNKPTVSLGGETPIGTWTIGTTPGPQTVTVSVDGVPDAVFTTTSVVGPPSSLLVIAGGGQSALAGTALPVPLQVRVRDAFLNPLPGVTVEWHVTAGGGEVAAASSVSNGAGEATAPQWTLGRFGGQQRMTAVAGAANLQIPANIQSDYVLDLRWVSPQPGGGVLEAFTRAVDRIEATIVGAQPDLVFTNFAVNPLCVPGITLNETVPGIIIYANVEPIDGPGGTLGSAGPCYTRNSNGLTVVGRMRFDSADLDNMLAAGTLESVVLHEMFHIIGIGTLWTGLGLKVGDAPGSTPFFTGAQATSACINDNGGAAVCSGTGVPIEDCLNLTGSCGGGTINAHWKESTFRLELMTGFASPGTNPMSKFTVLSLADMGYTVNVNTADAYTVPPPGFQSLITPFTVKLSEPTGPIAALDATGTVVRTYPNQPNDH